jgi:hypothetical protein
MRPAAVVTLLLALPLPAADKPVAVKLGRLSAPAPADWKAEKPANNLRSYQFKLPGEKGGPGDAELVVMQSGRKEKEFPRWRSQFVPPDGKTADDVGTIRKLDAAKGATIDLLDATGTWKYKAAPFDPKSKEELKDDYRVVWAVVSDGEETNQLRLSGPRETVDKYYPGFEKWLKALK